MPARVLLAFIALLIASGIATAAQPPHIAPGVYTGAYTCSDRVPVPVDFYVLDQYEKGYRVDDTKYQKVRVVEKDIIFTAAVILNGMKQTRIVEREFEKLPSGGRNRMIYAFDLENIDNGLRGTTAVPAPNQQGYEECRFVARFNPDASLLSSMSYATRKAALPPAYAKAPLPDGYQPATPTAAETALYTRTARAAVEGDAENWAANRLQSGSIGDYAWYALPGDPSAWLLRLSYRYSDFYTDDVPGWAEIRFRNGGLECVRFHDRGSCTRPRPARSQQIAALGHGGAKLGPVAVPVACFRSERRVAPVRPVYSTVRVGPGPGDFEQRVTGYTGGETFTVDVYQCERRVVAIDCVAAGADKLTEWLVGVGTTRNKGFRLVPGQTDVTKANVTELNARIADGTCIRTR